MNKKFTQHDLWFFFALPVYQLIGTFRHEISHLIAALLEGARSTEFVVWPTLDPIFRWGYVRWIEPTSWFVTAAPYFIDLITFIIFLFLCLRIQFRHWIFFNLLIIGLVSPFINSLYNYVRGFIVESSDVAKLFSELPPIVVHLYFLVTILFYLGGMRRAVNCYHNMV